MSGVMFKEKPKAKRKKYPTNLERFEALLNKIRAKLAKHSFFVWSETHEAIVVDNVGSIPTNPRELGLSLFLSDLEDFFWKLEKIAICMESHAFQTSYDVRLSLGRPVPHILQAALAYKVDVERNRAVHIGQLA